MKNTKELRKQFADAIMDGRFDDILEDHMKPEETIGRSEELHIAKDILENVLKGSCGAKGMHQEYGHHLSCLGSPCRYDKWVIKQDMFHVTVELEEIQGW